MARVKVMYADGRVEVYVSSAVFRRARQGDAQAAFYSGYILSPEWRARRARHLAKHPNCRGCGVLATLVHHRSYESLGCEREKHLVSLCVPCHARVHLALHKKEQRLRRWRDDVVEMENGRLYSVTNYIVKQLRREHRLA